MDERKKFTLSFNFFFQHGNLFLFQLPFHLATIKNNIDAMLKLLENGAKITSKCPDGNLSIHYAASNGSVVAVQMLMHFGLSPELKGFNGTI